MPQPTASDLHVKRLLTDLSIAYMQNPAGFVADQVFPNVPVNKESDLYARYDRSDFFRNQFRKRGNATESAGSGWKVDNTANYFCEEWALHKDITDRDRGSQDEVFDLDRDATQWLAQQALISREVNWASAYFTTGVWKGIDGSVGDITGVSGTPSTNQVLQWSDVLSDPIGDVSKKSTLTHRRTALRPNMMVIGREVWDSLKVHPDILDRVKYSSGNSNPALVTREAVAAIFELEKILVMDGIQVTSAENKDFETSMTMSFIGGKGALLVYAAPRPNKMQPSGGYTFSYKGNPGSGPQGMRIKKFRMDSINADRVEGEMYYTQKLVCAEAGIYFTTIVA